jgi:anaerobic ribonucleoside-triphosphate reductase activating protein
MNYQSITYPDVNNGLGCRVTLWVSGCPHHCKGCHNQHTWDVNSGQLFSDKHKKQLFEILSKPYIKGLTLSGGEPLFIHNISKLAELTEEIKIQFPHKDIWLYTGYTLEEIKDMLYDTNINMYLNTILTNSDYIVEGRYIEDLKDTSLAFRGSKNQHVYKIVNKYCNFEYVEFNE